MSFGTRSCCASSTVATRAVLEEPSATIVELGRNATETEVYVAAPPAAIWPLVTEIATPSRFGTELREASWIDPARELMDAVIAPGVLPTTEGQPGYMAVYRKVLKLPSFHDFPCHPALMRCRTMALGF